MRTQLTACALVLAGVSIGSAQSVNIDFGSASGTPPPTYAAEGLAGVWNALEFQLKPGEGLPPTGLVGLDGRATSVTIAVEYAYGTLEYPHAETDGEVAMLMDDALFGLSPDIAMSLFIDGLERGTYRVITYTWDWPTELLGMVTFIDGLDFVQSVGGPWTGALELGVTHMTHEIEVTGGAIGLTIVASGPGSFFNGSGVVNGIQLWKLKGAACPADLDGDGQVDGADLGQLLAAWGGRGPADLDGSGTVDGADLGLMLASFGPCPKPVGCGDPGLGDCYAAHDSAGCAESACCEAICALDSFCCAIAWDGSCVGLANLSNACAFGIPPHCGNPIGGSCFESNDLLPGCEDAECCDTVCSTDPFCCEFAWDTQCASEAGVMCAP